jgi:hypothetical protein
MTREIARDRFLAAGDRNTSPQLDDELHSRKHEGRSWFRKGDANCQFDHAFCDADSAMSLTSCDIDPYPAEQERLSDHAPLLVRLAEPVGAV